MKNRKVLIVAGAALLALFGVGLLSLRNGSAPVDAAPSPRQNAAVANPVGRRLVPAPACVSPARTNVVAAATTPAMQTPTDRGTLPFVLTSKTPFTKPLRLAAESFGAKTVSFVSRKSILVEATPEACARLKADTRFEDIVEFAPAEKIQPELAALVEKGEKTVEVSIVSLNEIDRETVIAALTAAGGVMLKGCINEGDTVRAKIPSDLVATLAARGEVRWMERFVRPEFTNDQAVKPGAMDVISVWDDSRDLGLTGVGQKITTSDSGIDTGEQETLHLDLRNRVKAIHIVSGCDTADYNGHGTHTAGSIVGDGSNCSGKYRGTAHGADLYAWFCGAGGGRYVYTPDKAADLFRPDDVDAYIHSASWGSGYTAGICGDYTADCADYDRYVWNHPDFLPVFSAGNDGEYGVQTVGSPGSAKNVLAVGATVNLPGNPSETASFSSRGPCKDGRIKPDVAAPGHSVCSTRSSRDGGGVANGYTSMSGTSMSCPLTAGSVALVRQWLVEKMHFDGVTEISPGVTNEIPTAALMKAVIMGGAYGAETPGNAQGWGRVKLADTLAPVDGRAIKLIDRIPFEQDFVTNIVIETTNAAPLDVQLVWVDYPGSSSGSQSTPRLVNDLDLTVEQYGGGEGLFYRGNGGDEPDTLNNVESVRIASATATKYVITIDCKTILHDHTEGGAAALYIRGAFDPAVTPEAPKCVHLEKANEDFFSLDMALAAVRDDGETVKILRPTRFSKSVTIPTNCTVVTEASDPSVTPVVLCAAKAQLSVPKNVTVEVEGVAFTNVCAGLVVDGSLKTSAGTSFASLAAVTVTSDGTVTLNQTSIAGDTPMLSLASNGVVTLRKFSVAGEKTDWAINGKLQLGDVMFASNQTVSVAATGNLSLDTGVANLARVTLEDATQDCLTIAGSLTESIAVDARKASGDGEIFAAYTCDFATAEEAAKRLYNAGDPDLGGVAVSDSGKVKWGIVTVPIAEANCILESADGQFGYRTFAATLRALQATGKAASITVVKDVQHTNTLSLAHDLVLTSTGGGILSFAADAGFVVPTGTELMITNLVVSGTGTLIKDCAFKVTGGELTLESGATLSGLRDVDPDDVKSGGGTIYVKPGRVTMKSGSLIENCQSQKSGGAIYLNGYSGEAVADLFGGTITNCSAASGGGVSACCGAKVNVQGDFTAIANTKGEDKFVAPSNLYLSPDTSFTLTDALWGSVGVSFGVTTPDLNATNVSFVSIGEDLTEDAKTFSALAFSNDSNTNLIGSYASGEIVWTERALDDGQCDMSEANYFVVIDEGGANEEWRYYKWIEDAFEHLDCDATVYCREGDWLGRDIEIRHAVRLASYGQMQTIQRVDDARVRILPGGSLTLENVQFSGLSNYTDWYPYYYENNSSNGLFSVEGGSLTLDNGAVVGPVDGSDSRAANAISVFNGGTLTMLSGSSVYASQNTHVDAGDATGCGGGVLLDNATAYFRGGTVQGCKAYRAGGVYVANGSKAYISGDFQAASNTDLTNGVDNVVVANKSELILAEAFTGSVGVNEGIACDTNCFGTVSTNWLWTIDSLTNSAAKFFHDKRNVRGAAATNGLGGAVLVWSDLLNKAGKFEIGGDTYQIFLAPGQTVAVPKAFSVTPTEGASGKMILTLEGGVEGCWYTVYSTEDLNVPFTVEKSVQLKAGEEFCFEVDQTKTSKFYKVVAEEGLK